MSVFVKEIVPIYRSDVRAVAITAGIGVIFIKLASSISGSCSESHKAYRSEEFIGHHRCV